MPERIWCRKGLFKTVRNKPLASIAVCWCLFLIVMTIVNFQQGNQNIKRYDILINSYMRSGSSFVGQLLAFHPDTFYWYEPLWSQNGLYYYMGKYPCVRSNVCGDFGDEEIAGIHSLLENLYSCNLRELSSAVSENITAMYSGASWKAYLTCREQNNLKSICLDLMEEVCKTSKHRAAKIVRLTVDNLEHVLRQRPEVKAIQLIRDPRATINSKLTTKWNHFNESDQNSTERIKEDAVDLCTRIKYDLIQGEQLKEKFPERFAFVLFEDMQTDLKHKAHILYSYFGRDTSDIDSSLANIADNLQDDHKVKGTRGDYTNWWRFQLSMKTVKLIDVACNDILSFLGYKIFTNENDLKNISNKAFNLKRELLISNMNDNQLYDFTTLRNSKVYTRNILVTPKHGNTIRELKVLKV